MNIIQKGIKFNRKYQQAEDYSKKIEGISRITNWFETKSKYQGAKRIIDQRKKSTKQLQFGRRELIIRRSTRIQQLYENQYHQWETQLKQQGLAIYKTKV